MPTDLELPFQLLPLFRERVWGRQSLAPFFPNFQPSQPVGEAWFSSNENRTSVGHSLGSLLGMSPELLGSAADSRYPELCPLLVKILFTSSRLSVQVHPDDDYAAQHHQSLGKTEAWYILDAQPPGEVAIGFREAIEPARLREATRSGEIEDVLHWQRVQRGDVVFVPAGTVHAIGAGLTVCEIQQNSDITYRLYDYGRPRELHLDHGCRVARLVPHEQSSSLIALTPWREHLLACQYFQMERLTPKASIRIGPNVPHYLLLICVKGSGMIANRAVTAGQCWMVPADGSAFCIEGPGSEWVLAYTAPGTLDQIYSE